jgi:hypothetical protein
MARLRQSGIDSGAIVQAMRRLRKSDLLLF